MRRKLMACFLGAATGLTLAACGNSPEGTTVAADCKPAYDVTTVEEGVLTIVAPDYPPLFTYEDEELGGVDGEFFTYFAKKVCLTTKVEVLPAAGVIEAIRGGRADVAGGGWYITPDRAEIIGQSEPFYKDPPVFVSKDPSADLDDYQDKTIGTTQGYLWVDDLQEYSGDNAKLYQSPDAVFSDVLNGRIDVGLMAVAEASFRITHNSSSGLKYEIVNPNPAISATEEPPVTNVPFVKDNAEMGAALNAAIADFRADGGLTSALETADIDPAAGKP